MKVVAKPIEMVVWFEKDGKLHPIRFKLIESNESEKVIKVGRVITREEEKFEGKKRLIFNCQSIVSGVDRLFQIKYEINTCKWVLYKI